MNIQELIIWGRDKLFENDIDKYGSCIKISQILLSFVLDKDMVYLHIHDDIVSPSHTQQYKELIQRACNSEPIEYILGKVSFYSKEFFVNKNVLIPRPETELLIDNVLSNIDDKNDSLSIAEIGVGSGVVSIILSMHLQNARFIASDISQEAIDVAIRNTLLYRVNNISFVHTSLLEGVDRCIDILISNPPYIQNNMKLDANLGFEPQIALFGGVDGDEILREIIDVAYVKNVKILACEIGYDQRDRLTKYIKQNYEYESLVFYKDLSQYDRGFVLRIQR